MKSQPTWQELFSKNEDIEPKKIYVIAFTPRSGSTWLGSIVEKSKALGIPREWFNHHAADYTIRTSGAREFSEYYQFIKQFRKSNGVFGGEVAYPHLRKLLDEGYETTFDDVDAWFFLRRRDYVAQAVSLYRAAETGIYHVKGEKSAPKIDLAYDREKIERAVLSIMNQEYKFNEYFERRGVTPTALWYEDLLAMQPAELIGQMAAAVEVEVDLESEAIQKAGDTDFKVTADNNSKAIIEQFKQDNAKWVEFWDANRGKSSAWEFSQKQL